MQIGHYLRMIRRRLWVFAIPVVAAVAAFLVLGQGGQQWTSKVEVTVPTLAQNTSAGSVAVYVANFEEYLTTDPAGDSADVLDARNNQLNSVSDAVARGVLPGNMMAFGGPDSKATADLVVDAFSKSRDGSFKGVVILFVGAAADQDRVKEAVAKSGAEFRFVEMK